MLEGLKYKPALLKILNDHLRNIGRTTKEAYVWDDDLTSKLIEDYPPCSDGVDVNFGNSFYLGWNTGIGRYYVHCGATGPVEKPRGMLCGRNA